MISDLVRVRISWPAWLVAPPCPSFCHLPLVECRPISLEISLSEINNDVLHSFLTCFPTSEINFLILDLISGTIIGAYLDNCLNFRLYSTVISFYFRFTNFFAFASVNSLGKKWSRNALSNSSIPQSQYSYHDSPPTNYIKSLQYL